MRERTRTTYPNYGCDPDGRYFANYQKIAFFGGWAQNSSFYEPRLLDQFNASRPWYYRTITNNPFGYESIRDVSDRSYYKSNKPVTHSKLMTVNYPVARAEADLTRYTPSYGYKGYFCGLWHTRFLPSRYTSMNYADLQTEATEYKRLITTNVLAEAYWTMRPFMEAKTSIVNSLFELKDFRDIANIFGKSSFWKSVNKTYHNLTRFGQQSLRKNVKEFATTDWANYGAQGHLAYNYAVKPTISDIRDICESLTKSVEQAQADLKKNAEGTTRHFAKNLATVSSLAPCNEGSANMLTSKGDRLSATFRATMSFSYHYEALNRSKAFAQYWGLQWDPEKIWNALPLSFLFDYVIGIGKALHVMRQDPQVSDLVAKSYVLSYAFTRTRGLHLYTGPDWNGSYYHNGGIIVNGNYHYRLALEDSAHADGQCFKHYKRWIGTPYIGPYLPEVHGMSRGHMLNTVALAKVML